MSFFQITENSKSEFDDRRETHKKLLKFGVSFLDDATEGIFPGDLVLLGASSGSGKTQMCCNIALSNMEEGKKIHYIALEADRFEIERRLKYPLVTERWLSDRNRPRIENWSFKTFRTGEHIDKMLEYELSAQKFFEGAYQNLFMFYKQDKFDVNDLIMQVLNCSDETDLVIVDHVQYFDFEDFNENRAIKEIVMQSRKLVIDEGRKMILVSHLRKSDRFNEDLVPSMEEFHGSSDLFKVATKVVTMSPGKYNPDDCSYDTHFRVCKDRNDNGASRFSAKIKFFPKKGRYDEGYELGKATQLRSKGFEAFDSTVKKPEWARRCSALGGDNPNDAFAGQKKFTF